MMMQATPNQDNDGDDSTTTITQLPAALTAHILQFVPQRQRLSCCALVCGAWRDAAAQATVHIDRKLSSTAGADALVSWLEQHGDRLLSLELRYTEGDEFSQLQLQLPWAVLAQLQSLHLTYIHLPAINGSNSSAAAAAAGTLDGGSGGSDGQTSDMPLLPRLKQLQLQECRMHSFDSLLQLASSTGLTSLVVETWFCVSTDHQQSLTSLLERLPQLVVLQLPQLPDFPLSRAAIKHVAGMDSLQHLQLAVDEGSACGDCLADLPSSLTRLQLDDWRCEKFEQPTLPPQLQQLTALQQLQLERCSLLPAVLASIPQLQHLELQDCFLLPCEAYPQQNPAATAALLGALQQLTRLHHLEIHSDQLAAAGEPPPQQWAALTASTQLTHLSLVRVDHQPLPQGAAQHMFAAGRQLPRLQKLVIQSYIQPQGDWCLDGADLGSIISCCPQLHELSCYNTVRAGADVSALLQLPSNCTRLSIAGEGFADAAAPVVAHLTQLRDLSWVASPQLTDAGLQQLTALQGLSHLWVSRCHSLSDRIWEAAAPQQYTHTLDLKSTDTKGPVWQQLHAVVVAASQPGVGP